MQQINTSHQNTTCLQMTHNFIPYVLLPHFDYSIKKSMFSSDSIALNQVSGKGHKRKFERKMVSTIAHLDTELSLKNLQIVLA